jgi:hypothetical protein
LLLLVADDDQHVEDVHGSKSGQLVVQEGDAADLSQALGSSEMVSEATAFAGSEDEGLHGSLPVVRVQSPQVLLLFNHHSPSPILKPT